MMWEICGVVLVVGCFEWLALVSIAENDLKHLLIIT